MKIAEEKFKKEKSVAVLMQPCWDKGQILIFSNDGKRLDEAEKFILDILDKKDDSLQKSLSSSRVGRKFNDSTNKHSQYDKPTSEENAASNSRNQNVSSRAGRKFETSVKHASHHDWSMQHKGNDDEEDNLTSHDTRGTRKYFEFSTKEGLKVKLYRGSITKLNVDAIVNAANEHLRNIGGVAQAISSAAGRALEDGCREQINKRKVIHVSENCVTVAGHLPCTFVIHAVGPNWHDYREKIQCLNYLSDTVVNILKTSQERKFKVVVMPPISSVKPGFRNHDFKN
ncbi:hypothetical protein KUTeg_005602 [Tegillarca granosa]|uniref:Macro domain-containing protein n=1 Tax=Tegillarca granosa TaxID=220873 RepID=A0ABQ9FPR5_TEGGR|nr:hypothetical protein KUTeg_005602 [Tegillarca granosa]